MRLFFACDRSLTFFLDPGWLCDSVGGSDTLRLLRQKLRHESLAFGDSLDLDRDRLHTLLEPLQSLR